MANHGRTKRAERFGADLDRPRNVQFDVRHSLGEKGCSNLIHPREIFHKQAELASEDLAARIFARVWNSTRDVFGEKHFQVVC
jgi:hypothetical protein